MWWIHFDIWQNQYNIVKFKNKIKFKKKKRCSTSLIIRDMQIKTTMRYHLIPVRWLLSKSLQTINAEEGVKEKEPSYTVSGNAN